MDPVFERMLRPDIVWVFIPILAIFFWGVVAAIRALRGEPEDFENWRTELEQLRARVEQLERSQQASRPGEATVPTPIAAQTR